MEPGKATQNTDKRQKDGLQEEEPVTASLPERLTYLEPEMVGIMKYNLLLAYCWRV